MGDGLVLMSEVAENHHRTAYGSQQTLNANMITKRVLVTCNKTWMSKNKNQHHLSVHIKYFILPHNECMLEDKFLTQCL